VGVHTHAAVGYDWVALVSMRGVESNHVKGMARRCKQQPGISNTSDLYQTRYKHTSRHQVRFTNSPAFNENETNKQTNKQKGKTVRKRKLKTFTAL
jgi:hypothetical protein